MMRERSVCPLTALLLMVVVLWPGGACLAQNSGGDGSGEPTFTQRRQEFKKRFSSVMTRLKEEADALSEVKDPEPMPRFTRPHPMLRSLSEDDSAFLLEEMLQPLTGNDYEDSYIRWHLIPVINDRMASAAEEAIASQRLGDMSEIGPKLIRLFQKMPPPITGRFLPEYRDVPEDIARQWHKLYYSTTTEVGYPPFQEVYRGREALKHMGDSRRAKMLPVVEEMERLRPLWKRIHDPDAIAFNKRVRQMNTAIRQYRGDLAYNVVLTGDPSMLKLVINKAADFAKQREQAAFDLIQYVYKAAFEGYLPLYQLADQQLLVEAASALRTAGGSASGFFVVQRNGEDVPRWYKPRYRSFEDYIFHLSFMLEDIANVPDPRVNERPTVQGKQRLHRFTASNFTEADIDFARRRAIEAIYRIEPDYEIIEERKLWRLSRTRGKEYFTIVHAPGNQAAALWALVAAQESYQNPDLLRRLHWVLSSDAAYSYDRGLRSILLANLPAQRWRQHLRRDAIWLSNAMHESGGFPYENLPNPKDLEIDLANSQYAVLGLWAMQKAGFDVRQRAWETVDNFWRKSFRKTGKDVGGWALYPPNAEAADAEARAGTVTGPMTAGGVSTLMLTDRFLRGPKMLDPTDNQRTPELAMGINWLDQNFSLNVKGTLDENDFFYYMWTVQRVGQASGYRTFNDVDWFRDVTANVLSSQQADGTWEGPKGDLLSTAFALLYLGGSYQPLAIGKIRVDDGSWNNRPHDLWNFVEWASDEYEVDTGWQIFELETSVNGRKAPQHVYQLIDAPIQYFSTSDYVQFNDNQIRALRDYIRAGGMLVTNTDGTNADAGRTIRELGEKLFPDREFEDVPNDHPFYGVHREVGLGMPLRMISNHLRPLWVHSQRDLSRPLQQYDPGRSDAFALLSNIYLYTVGMNPRRTRMKSDYLIEQDSVRTPHRFSIARVQHDGRYDPEPAALEQLSVFMNNNHGVDLQVSDAAPASLSGKDMAFLTITDGDTLGEDQTTALRNYVQGGGTLWIDAAGGTDQASTTAFELLQKIMPGQIATRLLADSPIVSGQHTGEQFGHDMGRVRFRPYALRVMGPVNSPRLQAIEVDGRPAVIFSAEDVTCGLAGLGHWGIFGYLPESARKLVANSILFKLHHGGENLAARN